MALSESEVELIRASWSPARADPTGAGILLFKGLFTKFPDYLKFFNQFSDLDLENIHEDKRLIRHAVKAIDTVTFVVDSVGDPTRNDLLNEALVNLVRGHLKRRIGLEEFRNLGIVLIDFICDLSNRRQACGKLCNPKQHLEAKQLAGASSSASSSQDSETMTIALDKIRASSSPSSSSEGETLGLLDARVGVDLIDDVVAERRMKTLENNVHGDRPAGHHEQDDYSTSSEKSKIALQSIKMNTGLLVAAWTKLYGTILELVENEEARASE